MRSSILILGVCCSNGKHCCPQGSTCASNGEYCKYPGGLVGGVKRVWKPQDTGISVEPTTRNNPISSPIICPDRKSACPDNTTCCPMGDVFGCCNAPNSSPAAFRLGSAAIVEDKDGNPFITVKYKKLHEESEHEAVCCSDQIHCCPHGTKCDVDTGSCSQSASVTTLQSNINALLSSTIVWPKLNKPRTSDHGSEALSYDGVMCEDHIHECPRLTTCCKDASGQTACCPMPDAVCCSDGIHCCPKDTTCDVKLQKCVAGSEFQAVKSPQTKSIKGIQLCPDGQSRCLDDQTCCPMSDKKTWGCCPVPEGLCCSDGEHCCPKGYNCNAQTKTCVKHTLHKPELKKTVVKNQQSVECPNPEFRCDNGTTCCSLPNNEWACCPFPNATCCSDEAHCCPENSSCDLANNRCITSSGSDSTTAIIPIANAPRSYGTPRRDRHVCEDGQSACSAGSSCCQNKFGFYSCCPFEEAVCCPDGLHCCPKGSQCAEASGQCVPSDKSKSLGQIPWLKKIPARRTPTTAPSKTLKTKEQFTICPDGESVCDGDRTCCPLAGGSFGCCPLENGTCCADKLHCCPASTTCNDDGQCIRHRQPRLESSLSTAHRMVPTLRTLRQSNDNQHMRHTNLLALPVRSQWCGDRCMDGWFCCPDATNTGLSMCCPASAGICCSDGQHCCPRGTRCITGGMCEADDDVDVYMAPYVVPAKHPNRKSEGFLRHIQPKPFHNAMALPAPRAKLDPLFLLPEYRQLNADRATVCPGNEHTCGLDEQCCPSRLYAYVCTPKGTKCCSAATNTYCPTDSICSPTGSLCHKRRGPA